MKIALLIPTLPERKPLRDRLIFEILRQMNALNLSGGVNEPDRKGLETDVCILINEDNREKTTGRKRNELIQQAVEYGACAVAFLDDDDMIGPTYIKRAIEFANSGYDCAELWGQIYFNGKKGNPFHHFIDCMNPATGKIEWWQDDKYYYRMINHLNFVTLDMVKNIPFPDQVFGEDGKQSEAMRDAGIFKTMMPIPEIIYHYYVGEPKHELL